MWVGDELTEDFESLSEMRSQLMLTVEAGTTVRMLFDSLADNYTQIRQKIFCKDNHTLYSNIVTLFNNCVIRNSDLYNRVLEEGDKITILPIYVGG